MKKQNKQKKLPLINALLMIILSVCLISGSCLLLVLYYKFMKERQSSDPSYLIVAVVQTHSDAEGLKTAYLTELLGLSIDRPGNLFSFNAKEAREKLLNVSIIKDAHIAKIRPGTIHVDYSLRKPIAFFADFTNTAIDAEGVLFPLKPFFTPKYLPEIYTGMPLPSTAWGTKVSSKEIELAFALIALAPKYCDDYSTVRRIDVSRAFSQNNGERQIVLILEDKMTRISDGEPRQCIYPRFLRLSDDSYQDQRANYIRLRAYIRKQESAAIPPGKGGVHVAKASIIDLRLPQLAFITNPSEIK